MTVNLKLLTAEIVGMFVIFALALFGEARFRGHRAQAMAITE